MFLPPHPFQAHHNDLLIHLDQITERGRVHRCCCWHFVERVRVWLVRLMPHFPAIVSNSGVHLHTNPNVSNVAPNVDPVTPPSSCISACIMGTKNTIQMHPFGKNVTCSKKPDLQILIKVEEKMPLPSSLVLYKGTCLFYTQHVVDILWKTIGWRERLYVGEHVYGRVWYSGSSRLNLVQHVAVSFSTS